MADLSALTLPHGTIPTQMFGNVNLQNAVMFINENFQDLLKGINANTDTATELLAGKSDIDHTHDEAYAAYGHVHSWKEITGLSAMLDGKAELNHEHAQYLSSLPAHYHDVSGIQGLGEALQGKADATHGHTMAQVDGLGAAIADKASTAYVDQQVANVSDSVASVAQEVVTSFAADTSIAANAPKDVVVKPDNETEAAQRQRIGKSVNYARLDHQHVVYMGKQSSDVGKMKHDGAGGTDGEALVGTESIPSRIDHSHPLNYPTGKPTSSIAKDGMGESGGASFGNTNYYADLGHSHPLNVAKTGTPSDVVKSTGSASLGTDETYSRTDHVHKMPALSATDIVRGSGTVDSDLSAIDEDIGDLTDTAEDHETRILALEGGSGGGTVKSVDGVSPGEDGNVVLNALTDDDIRDTVQPYSENLETLADDLTDAGKVPFSSIDGRMAGHSGNCLTYVNGSGEMGHVGDGVDGNGIYSLVEGLKNRGADKIITNVDHGNGLQSNDTNHNLEVKADTTSGIGADEDGVYAKLTEDGGLRFDDNGDIRIDSPTTAPTSNKVLTCKSGGIALSWESAMTEGTQTSPSAQSGADISTDAASDPYVLDQVTPSQLGLTQSTWTRGDTGTGGLAIGTMLTICTGVKKASDDNYYAHFANCYFDENGCLCKVETVRHNYQLQ